jgi:SAM-dependent methyltransferase
VPNSPEQALFDRSLARARLARALTAPGGGAGADFLLTRASGELIERLSLVKREFPLAVDVGTPGPHAARALSASGHIGFVARASPLLAAVGGGSAFVADEERLPLADGCCDLIVSLLALQGVNDLPGALIQARRALRPDGLFTACVMAGDSLSELRQSLTIAESEIRHGASPRVAPFADVRALGALLQRAGFALPVVDLDRAIVRYDDMIALMRDLRAMGAANALHARSGIPLRRDVLARAGEIYAARFADTDGRVRATFDMVWLSGWAPHESQQKPLKPGSARMRLEDALKATRG